MKSLRDRLAQFDRPVAPRAKPVVTEGDPLASVLEAGARWIGAAPTGHLRLEQTGFGADDPREVVGAEACRRLCGATPTGDHWVVLDTETTGLETGTGTLVFLVGLVHWTPTRTWRVQLLMPEPAAEASMLAALAEELDGTDLLISYNGRSFDVPRLRTRMRLQRQDPAVLERPHLDLVHPARGLLGGWLPERRQIDLETKLLGLARHDDLPGSHAPEVYRNLVADGIDTGLAGVVDHNARDVDRLVDLAQWFARCVDDHPDSRLPAVVHLSTARWLARRGHWPAAEVRLRALVDHDERVVATGARRQLAEGLRRQCRFAEAACEWESILSVAPHDVEAHVECAKIFEHRLRDLDRAHDVVTRALRAEVDRRTLDPSAPSVHAALVHRLRRLQRRRARGAGDAGIV